MRKVIAATFVSLDGFMVGPNEDISWVTETMNEEIRQEEIVGPKTIRAPRLARSARWLAGARLRAAR